MAELKGSFGKPDHVLLLIINEEAKKRVLCGKCEKNKSRLDKFRNACCYDTLVNHFKSIGWFNDVFIILNSRLFNNDGPTTFFLDVNILAGGLVYHPNEDAFYVCSNITVKNNMINTHPINYHYPRNKLDISIKKYNPLSADNIIDFMNDLEVAAEKSLLII